MIRLYVTSLTPDPGPSAWLTSAGWEADNSIINSFSQNVVEYDTWCENYDTDEVRTKADNVWTTDSMEDTVVGSTMTLILDPWNLESPLHRIISVM